MRIFVVIGTRPEAIKMLPLVIELRKYSEFETQICFSGQHDEIAKSVFDEYKIIPDFKFNAMEKGGELSILTMKLLEYFDIIFKEERPDLVLVHGDTTTAFCASLSAFYLGIKVAHVEAGLRTFDCFSPFPEEFNRVSIDALSTIHFAPTESAAQNLIKEGKKSVFTTGNTVIDALKYSLSEEILLPILDKVEDRKILLITTHRRENLGAKMQTSLLGIRDILEEYENLFAILPLHPNPRVREIVSGVFENIKNIKICEPLPMREFHHLLARSFAVFSDSGGIQEEIAYLGIPLFLLRDKTERVECLELPNVQIVGCDREAIRKKFFALINNEKQIDLMRKQSLIFGDGHASERIVRHLLKLTT